MDIDSKPDPNFKYCVEHHWHESYDIVWCCQCKCRAEEYAWPWRARARAMQFGDGRWTGFKMSLLTDDRSLM